MLNEAAYRLRALGRLTESLEPMRVGLEFFVTEKNWKQAAGVASNLSELELTLGEVTAAVGDAEQSVTYADRSGGAAERVMNRTTHADALHQVGRRAEAETLFREAEQMQAEDQPDYPLLYSLRGFQYCDLLLAAPERAAWARVQVSGFWVQGGGDQDSAMAEVCREVEKRAAQALKIAEGDRWLLDIALDHLTLGRAALYAATLENSAFHIPHSELDKALDGLPRAGQAQELPRGLLTRAWCSFAEAMEHRLHGRDREASACLAQSQADLDEAWEIAERGPMRLFLADIHLTRARLFGRGKLEGGRRNETEKYPWESPQADLAAAEKLINECGYHRRDKELADAKRALLGIAAYPVG